MSPDISAELKIPDPWYDFYARLLPGAAFVAAVYLLKGNIKWPTTLQCVLFTLAGYFSALVTQPWSSRITGKIHDWIAKKFSPDKDRLYVGRNAKSLPFKQQQILSKMHGETTFFVQCSILCLVLIVFQLFGLVDKEYFWLTIIALFAFLFGAFEVAHRRVKRVRDQLEMNRQQ